jgi:hypothetical protein
MDNVIGAGGRLLGRIVGAMLGEPRLGPGRRRVEQHPAALDEEHAVGQPQDSRHPLLGQDDGRPGGRNRREEELRALRVQLRRRLVEQEQLRPQRERRRETDALQLSSRQLGRPPPGQVERVDRLERVLGARPDLGRRRAGVLEPEGDLVLDASHHDLILRVLEDGRDRPRELGGSSVTRIASADDDCAPEAPTVEVRNEPSERAQHRRLARAGRSEHDDDLAGTELEGEIPDSRYVCSRVGERETRDGR